MDWREALLKTVKRVSHWPVALGLTICIATSGVCAGETPSEAGGITWRGGPLPEHRGLVITESALLHRVSSYKSNPERINFYLTGEVGPLINVGVRDAVGGTLYWGGHDDGSLLGVKARYRRWLGHSIGIDLAPGILFAGKDNYYHLQWPGFTGHIGLSIGDWIVLTGQLDVVRHSSARVLRFGPNFEERYIEIPAGNEVNMYVGGKLGSYLGPLGVLALAVIVAASY